MPQGTIKKLVADRGFGFISGTQGEDVFFHLSSLGGIQFEDLQEGQMVEYELEEQDSGGGRRGKGPRAATVKIT
jgi:CspA family cold shock protein